MNQRTVAITTTDSDTPDPPGPAARRPATMAAISVAATIGVIVFMDWVPTALNRNILESEPRQRLIGTLVHATAGAAALAAAVSGRRWPIGAGAAWFSVVLGSAVLNWWVPYLVGAYPGEISAESYQEEYSHNLTVLPLIADHPVVPDVQHSLIHLSVLLSAVAMWRAFRVASFHPAGRGARPSRAGRRR